MLRAGSTRSATVAAAVVLTALACAGPAGAAFPGQNGKIALSRGDGIWTVNPDGTGATRLTSNPYSYDAPDPMFEDFQGSDIRPAWSGDGTKIAFARQVLETVGECGGGGDAPPYYVYQFDIYVMNADGSGLTAVTNTADMDESDPAWSPDGSQLAVTREQIGFEEFGDCFFTFDRHVAVIDSGGQLVRRLSDGRTPSWAPDGRKIAFEGRDLALWTIEPDGSGATMVADDSDDPAWGPDGSRIAFGHWHSPTPPGSRHDIFTIDPDGSDEINVTSASSSLSWNPAWAPDGTRIAFSSDTNVYAITSDGSDRTLVTTGWDPDWQPLHPGYPRPRAASPMRVSLVPAYIACSDPNRTHAPPLAFDSCSPPVQRSGMLTVGTPDANGAPAAMVGSVRYAVRAGDLSTTADEADVVIRVSVTDVRCAVTNTACPGGPLSDYTGRLLALGVSTRITDRSNIPPGPNGVPGTGNTQFRIPVDCTATASTSVGSTCAVSTTADALMPGAITEGRRAIWGMGQIHVRDEGPNGTGFEGPACPPDCGDGDETLFLREGVFVP